MSVTVACPSCGKERTLTRPPANPNQRCSACANLRYPSDWRCAVEGCEDTHDRRGDRCGPHYMQKWWSANRAPLTEGELNERRAARSLDRFWSSVDTSGDCWLWTGYVDPNGYGRFSPSGRWQLAHRHAYQLVKGPVPEGLELDHLCRNRSCVNPDHLEAVTHAVNMARGAFALKTRCPQGHPYSGENLIQSPKAGRLCRTCQRGHGRKRATA